MDVLFWQVKDALVILTSHADAVYSFCGLLMFGLSSSVKSNVKIGSPIQMLLVFEILSVTFLAIWQDRLAVMQSSQQAQKV